MENIQDTVQVSYTYVTHNLGIEEVTVLFLASRIRVRIIISLFVVSVINSGRNLSSRSLFFSFFFSSNKFIESTCVNAQILFFIATLSYHCCVRLQSEHSFAIIISYLSLFTFLFVIAVTEKCRMCACVWFIAV